MLRSIFRYSPAHGLKPTGFYPKRQCMSHVLFQHFLGFTFVNLDALPEKPVLKTLTHRSCRTMNTRVSYRICWGNILGT